VLFIGKIAHLNFKFVSKTLVAGNINYKKKSMEKKLKKNYVIRRRIYLLLVIVIINTDGKCD